MYCVYIIILDEIKCSFTQMFFYWIMNEGLRTYLTIKQLFRALSKGELYNIRVLLNVNLITQRLNGD